MIRLSNLFYPRRVERIPAIRPELPRKPKEISKFADEYKDQFKKTVR